jgi:hypothetical protein
MRCAVGIWAFLAGAGTTLVPATRSPRILPDGQKWAYNGVQWSQDISNDGRRYRTSLSRVRANSNSAEQLSDRRAKGCLKQTVIENGSTYNDESRNNVGVGAYPEGADRDSKPGMMPRDRASGDT